MSTDCPAFGEACSHKQNALSVGERYWLRGVDFLFGNISFVCTYLTQVLAILCKISWRAHKEIKNEKNNPIYGNNILQFCLWSSS